ncbi:MAG: fused MFS/spermidine synthase, partial [Candidatus Omnitrophica bacterium]|nr:fused MFS/spermidine synthase [Candidatus Omnitrophota bacterium]
MWLIFYWRECMSSHRLNVRDTGSDLFFYIDGSLQFAASDEHIYHELLAAASAFISTPRVKKPLNALIMGGGDGLCLREILKVETLKEVTLVDYDKEVLELARTTFSPWNKNSLCDSRVNIQVKDAREYLASTKKIFDLIIADFTFPSSLDECGLFTSKFFYLVGKRLSQRGIFALNAVSPYLSCAAYWSIFKTLLSLKIYPKPMHANIPSFVSHGYGEWGFFLASKTPVSRREIKNIKLPQGLRFLTAASILESMQFPCDAVRPGFLTGNILEEPCDLLGFLNTSELWPVAGSQMFDFSYSLS